MLMHDAEARTLAPSGHMLVFEQHGPLTETLAAFATSAIPASPAGASGVRRAG